MDTKKLERRTFFVTALSLLPHLLCCGIPAIAALVSLGTTIGLSAALLANPFYQMIDQFHPYLIGVAITGVLLSGIFNLIAYRVNCRETACTHGSCKPKKIKSFRIFLISLTLLIVDLAWFATEEFVLGTHDYGAHEHNH